MALPTFWRSRLEDVDDAVHSATRGDVSVLTRSPGGRPVYLVRYGTRSIRRGSANYNSAVGARDPRHYADKPADAPPSLLLIGPVHGQEVENIVGIVNLIHVAEAGVDLRGRAWDRLRQLIDACHLLIVPVGNPDGRARCPYESFVGVSVDEMTRVGQGTRQDGSLYGWPGAKQRHPMVGDVGLLGAYFNDQGINPMHDEFFAPMASETKALLDLARDEAPDYLLNLHSHGTVPQVLRTAYVPHLHKRIEADFARRLYERYDREGLPSGQPFEPVPDGEELPLPSFNLTSALHHVCGGVSMLYECSQGLVEYVRVSHDDILNLELLLFEEWLAFAVEHPDPRRSYEVR